MSTKNLTFLRWIGLAINLCLWSLNFSNVAFSGVHLGASGAWAQNHLGLETHTARMLKGSVAIDLGAYFRIGYSFSETLQHREGYMYETSDELNPIAFEQDVIMNTHSLDLFAVLYAGTIFTPYIFAGGAYKSYIITLKKEDQEPTRSKSKGPSPNGGCGLAIALGSNFSLKFSSTWSSGVHENLDGTQESVLDQQLDLGISYKL